MKPGVSWHWADFQPHGWAWAWSSDSQLKLNCRSLGPSCFAPDSASEDDPNAGCLKPMLGKPVALRQIWALLNGNLSIDNLQLLRASGPLPVQHSYQGLTWGAAVRFGSDVRAAPAAASLGPSAWSAVEPKQPFWFSRATWRLVWPQFKCLLVRWHLLPSSTPGSPPLPEVDWAEPSAEVFPLSSSLLRGEIKKGERKGGSYRWGDASARIAPPGSLGVLRSAPRPSPDQGSPAGLASFPRQNNRGREVGFHVAIISTLQTRWQRPLASVLGPPHSISNTVLTVIKKKVQKTNIECALLKIPSVAPRC